MDRLARVLFHMDTLNPHQPGDTGLHVDQNLAFTHQRFI